MKNLIFTLTLVSLLQGCARSAQDDLDDAVQTHIQAKNSTEAEDACRKVFIKSQQNKDSGQLCTAL